MLLVLAAGAVVTAFALVRPAPAASFSCPMHADVRAAAPGVCPLCGMALERGASPAGPGAPRPLTVSDAELFAVRPRVFSREIRGPARVEPGGGLVALLHADELDSAAREGGATFTTSRGASSNPSSVASVDVAAAPLLPVDDETSWMRLRFAAGARPFAPGTVGWVSWPARPRTTLVVPETAIARGPEGPYVLVAAPNAPLGVEKRVVQIGKVFQGLAVVVSGLTSGERVVGDALFSWDAERRLQAVAGGAASGAP